MVVLSKCDGISFIKNRFFNDNGRGDVLYSEMPKEYTYNITFRQNRYSNSENDSFVLNNVATDSLEGWKKR